jgi:hypothetical protein
MGFRAAAEVAFKDRAGVSWVRRGTGELEELPAATLDYYRDFGVQGPYEFQTPEPTGTVA